MLYAGNCPRCEQGLLGFRICCGASRCLIVCDECEAVWSEPELKLPPGFAETDGSGCPLCGEPLWQDRARWATHDDVQSLGWDQYVRGELADP